MTVSETAGVFKKYLLYIFPKPRPILENCRLNTRFNLSLKVQNNACVQREHPHFIHSIREKHYKLINHFKYGL